MFIGNADGLSLQAWLSSNPGAQLHLSALGETPFQSGIVATGSSGGPTPAGELKPDVAAPGLFIYSGAIRTPNPGRLSVADPSGFLAVSGTSQASPHGAGAAALIKQLHPSWSPLQIKSALISSSVNDLSFAAATQTPAGLLRGGAGRIDLQRALSAPAGFQPSTLSFGFLKLKAARRGLSANLNITNLTAETGSFNITTSRLDSLPGAAAGASASTLTLRAGETQTVTFSLTADATAVAGDYTGYVIVSGPGGQTQHVPYWVRLRGQ
jgi:subtilisin family serine protease